LKSDCSLSHAQARIASETFFTSGFLPHQQSGPQTALARHGELSHALFCMLSAYPRWDSNAGSP